MNMIDRMSPITDSFAQWHELAQQLRIDSIRATTAAGSGHPSSSMSAADLMAVLLINYLRYDFSQPHLPNNDHLIFSKGHASPLLYALYKAAGAISDDELLTLRKEGSRLEGHPTPVLPWVEVATGSLGQGLPTGVGIALAGHYLDHLPYHVWVLLGDSEMAEGSIWEALELGGHYHLSNLIGILDMNRLGQRGETMLGWNSDAYAVRVRAFGWHALEIDGHDYDQISRSYEQALHFNDAPTLIIAKTIKGKGFSLLENQGGWHGKPLPQDLAQQAIAELGGVRTLTITVKKPEDRQPTQLDTVQELHLPTYALGQQVATRTAYGDALTALGKADPKVVVTDGEVSNSTYAETFAKALPNRYFEAYIAEQQLVALAVGLQVRGYTPFASTFAAFFSRAYDFIRMAAISRANIRLTGSHAGVSIGEDGPSQMALEDIAMMRAIYGSTVLYPCDANQTVHLVCEMQACSGVVYLRTTREKMPILYDAGEDFPIGGSKVLRQSEADQATVVAAGITVHEALAAYEILQRQGITIRVIDAYSVKPIDASTLHAAALATGGRIIVVEDHWPEGGVGDAVLAAFSGTESQLPSSSMPTIIKLAVGHMPGSAAPAQQLDAAGISAEHIVRTVQMLLL
jgi:transketolase